MVAGSFEKAAEGVLDSSAALDVRIRSLYDLKAFRADKPAEVSQVLIQAVDTTESVLLQHEFLYNVGQIGLASSIAPLQDIIANQQKYDEVSRHEAIEAIGAIGLSSAKEQLKEEGSTTTTTTDKEALDYLLKVQNDPKSEQPIVESCILAVERIQRIQSQGKDDFKIAEDAEFVSVDPAPAPKEVKVLMEQFKVLQGQPDPKKYEELEGKRSQLCKSLATTLNDEKASLWDRYAAMFGLRDLGSDEAVEELSKSLLADKSSALFRHEVAFVLGQLENAKSSPYLISSLKDEAEHPMVRHEAAEALGSVASKSDWEILSEYAKHKEPLVKDSCVVALDMHAYWSKFKSGGDGEQQDAKEEGEVKKVV